MGIKWSEQGKDGPLTSNQLSYLRAVGEWMDRWGEVPSCRSLAESMKVTPGAVSNMVQVLRLKGYMGRGYRGMMVITDKGKAVLAEKDGYIE